MKLSRYIVGILLCFILTSCNAQSASSRLLDNGILPISSDYSIQTLNDLVDLSDYIVVGEMMDFNISDDNDEEMTIRVLDQFKGIDDKVGKVITIHSAKVLSHEGTTYLLFFCEKEPGANEKKRYESLIHSNPILNNRFIEGPFKNMSFKDIRRDIIYCL